MSRLIVVLQHRILQHRSGLACAKYRPVCVTKCPYSTSTDGQKLYELRTYTVKPDNFKLFMDLSTEWMHLRTCHSKLVGYWISEIGGGIHDAVHIWEYDSLSHRASVRQTLGKDEVWQKSYFRKLLPLLQRQDNSLLQLFPGATLKDPPANGVYQLESFSLNPLKMDEIGNYFLGRQKPGATQLATFHTVLGISYFGYQLWHHPSVDNLLLPPVIGSQKIEGQSEGQDKGSELGVAIFQSRLLLPTPWSTMK